MSASLHTTNFNFPKFAGADKPAWLVDFNGAMDAIDSSIKTISDLLSTLSGETDDLGDTITTLQSSVTTLLSDVSTLQGVVATNVIDISTLESDLATTNTNLSNKADKASPTFTGTVTLPSTTSIGNVDSTEIGYLNGVTSSIQTQFDNRAPLHLGAQIITLVPNAINTITHNRNSTSVGIFAINGDTNANNFDITGVAYVNPNQFQFRANGGASGSARITYIIVG